MVTTALVSIALLSQHKVGQVFIGSVVRVISPTRFEVSVAPFKGKKKVIVRLFGLRDPANRQSYRESIESNERNMDVPAVAAGQILLEYSFQTKRIDRDGTLAVTMTGEVWDHMDTGYAISEYSMGENLLAGGIAKLNPRESTGSKGFIAAARKGREEGRGMWARFMKR